MPPGSDPLERLRASGRGYIHSAVENPGLFALMFRPDRLDTTNERFLDASGTAFERLVDRVRSAQDGGWRSDRETRLLSGVVWSAVHGLASLWSQGALLGPLPDASLENAIDLGLELVLAQPNCSNAPPLATENQHERKPLPVRQLRPRPRRDDRLRLTGPRRNPAGASRAPAANRTESTRPGSGDPSLFIGSGMVHGVRLEDGAAKWYRSRFVRDDAVLRLRGGDPVAGPANQGPGEGAANTNAIGHAGRTFAIVEAGGWPIELSDELETVARSDFDETLPDGFTAHPKVDPETGELHAACYTPFDENLKYLVVASDGKVHHRVDIPMPHKPMVHDCAITKKWFVVLDFPCVFDAQALADGYPLPYRWHPELGARVGLLPRHGQASDIVWCDVDPCYVFHPMNAFEDADGRVVLDVVRHPKMFATDFRGPSEGSPVLERWLVDPKGGPVKTESVDDRAQEFPRIDERLIGRPYRYGYSVAIDAGFETRGLLKHDMRNGTAAVHSEGEHRGFFEPVFVPAHDGAAEDEGWVLAYVHDAERNAADVVVLDAQDFAAPPIATIQLPARVPYGFHGNWVPDA